MPEKITEPFPAIKSARSMSRGQEDPGFKPVQDFLQRFGYLKADSFRAGQLDDPTAEGLGLYQRRHGLAPTGVFDEQTRAQMAQHRCGMPDLDSGVAFSTRCSWPNPNLTFAFEDGTNDVGGNGEFQAMRNAFNTWVAAAPLTFTEVGRTQNPDVAIDWRPANDPDHSMVGGVLAHADFPPGCGVVTNSLPKPVHFDDSEHQWVVGAVANGFDVETVGLHELGHILGLQHSDVAGSVMFASVSSNFTKRVLTADDLGGIRELYPPRLLAAGTYTIRQKSNGRFVDAHEIAGQGLPPGHSPGAEQRHPTVGSCAGGSRVCYPTEKQRPRSSTLTKSTETTSASSPAQRRTTPLSVGWLWRSATAARLSGSSATCGSWTRTRSLEKISAWSPDRHRTTTHNGGCSTTSVRTCLRSARRAMAASWMPTSTPEKTSAWSPARHRTTTRNVGSSARSELFTRPPEEQRPLRGCPRARRRGLPPGHPPGTEQRHTTLADYAGRRWQLHHPAVEQRPFRGRPRLCCGGLLIGHPPRPEQR